MACSIVRTKVRGYREVLARFGEEAAVEKDPQNRVQAAILSWRQSQLLVALRA